MDKSIEAFKELWMTVKPNGAIMLVGVVILVGGFISNKYLQLSLQSWQVLLLIMIGVVVLFYGFFSGSEASNTYSNTYKLKIKQKDDSLIIKNASDNSSNSSIVVKIDNIENERCLGDKVVGLPVNSEFQDDCLKRKTSAAGAYVNECLGDGVDAYYEEILRLFDGVPKRIGSTKLIKNFLNKGDNIIFAAVTENNNQGIITTTPINISYATQELVKTARTKNFLHMSCPVFGSGHGGVNPKTAIKAMIDGILGAFDVFGCNNMTVTIKVHNKSFNSIKELKKTLN